MATPFCPFSGYSRIWTENKPKKFDKSIWRIKRTESTKRIMQIDHTMVWKRLLETGMKIRGPFIFSPFLYNQLPSPLIGVNQVAREWKRHGSIKKKWTEARVIYSLLAIGELLPKLTKPAKVRVLVIKVMRLQWQTVRRRSHNSDINDLVYRVEIYPPFSPNKIHFQIKFTFIHGTEKTVIGTNMYRRKKMK